MIAARVRLLLVTLWVGSLWTVGYLVAPTLFASLPDAMTAGSIAGKLFRIEAWLTVVCSLSFIVLLKRWPGQADASGNRRLALLALAMLGCTLIGYFGLQPFMAALKESAADGMMDAATRARFGMLHGVSSILYLAQSLLGAALVWKIR